MLPVVLGVMVLYDAAAIDLAVMLPVILAECGADCDAAIDLAVTLPVILTVMLPVMLLWILLVMLLMKLPKTLTLVKIIVQYAIYKIKENNFLPFFRHPFFERVSFLHRLDLRR
jgi:hypothetical protein